MDELVQTLVRLSPLAMAIWALIFVAWLGAESFAVLGRLHGENKARPWIGHVGGGLDGLRVRIGQSDPTQERLESVAGARTITTAGNQRGLICLTEDNRVMAILAYIWILFLVPLLAAKGSRFARFHAYQGVALFLLSLLVGIIDRLLPYNLSGLSYLLSLAVLVLAIIGIVNAYQGKAKPLPVIGGFLTPKA